MVGTLGGGVVGSVLTQRQAVRRESRAWDRERERERQQHDREDEARTFEHRREAYLDFYVAVKELAKTAYGHSYGFTEPELQEGWQDEAFAKLHRLEFYADRELSTAAGEAYGAAWSWGYYGKYDDPDDPGFSALQQRYDDAELVMLGLMRARLSIPEGDPELPPPGYSYYPEGQAAADEPGQPSSVSGLTSDCCPGA